MHSPYPHYGAGSITAGYGGYGYGGYSYGGYGISTMPSYGSYGGYGISTAPVGGYQNTVFGLGDNGGAVGGQTTVINGAQGFAGQQVLAGTSDLGQYSWGF